MKTADVALVVSIFGALLAACALGWNITTFVKNGPKVKATLTMGTYGTLPEGFGRATMTIEAKVWAGIEKFRRHADQHFFITATNTGRAAIWVDEVGLCSAKGSTSMNVVTTEEERDSGFGPGLPVKLDAGQTARWALPLSNASSLWAIGSVSDTECVHGRVRLGNGKELKTAEGARVGLLREALKATTPVD